MTEAEVILAAGDYLRERGTSVTPAKVESFVRERLAQNGQLLPGAAVKEIVTAVNALTEKYPHNEKGQTTMKKEQQYAVPTPYFKTAQNTINLDDPIPSRAPATREEALAIADELRQLVASIDASLTPHELNQTERHILARGEMLGQYSKFIRGRIEVDRPGGGSRAGRQNG